MSSHNLWDDLPDNGPGEKSRRAASSGPVLLYAVVEARTITDQMAVDSRQGRREWIPLSRHRPPRGLLAHRADLSMPASLLDLDWMAAEQWERLRATDPGWAQEPVPDDEGGPGR
tara:strand:- start:1257 stop:1601 length:345 start_codon:yes stop_codon:yes gene_type:complete